MQKKEERVIYHIAVDPRLHEEIEMQRAQFEIETRINIKRSAFVLRLIKMSLNV